VTGGGGGVGERNALGGASGFYFSADNKRGVMAGHV
jgi:hypothetical protein